jgi:hypothetical protein
MKASERDGVAQIGRQMVSLAVKTDADGLKAQATDALKQDFNGVANAIMELKGDQGAAITIQNVYVLDNSTAKPGESSAQFFCGAMNTTDHVTFTLPDLKPGRYALVIAHATSIAQSRQLSLVLQDAGGWKLAGLIIKPLTEAGHDGLWYWQQARNFSKNHQLWNATLYLETAKALLMPVGFLSSQNSEKLQAEQQASTPPDWPSQNKPLEIPVSGKLAPVTEVRMLAADNAEKDITLIISYRMENAGANATVQQENTAVAQAVVKQLPEFREAFTQVLVVAIPPATNGVEGNGVPTTLPMKSL